ncbi:MAG TPA: diguanylate cyclase [Candidatus Acidoferrales bacterium]|nr:diguanylate cyclase [Candidatus Acidoferrales bacterium]
MQGIFVAADSSQAFILATGTLLGSDVPLRSLLPRLVDSLAAYFEASHAVLVLPAEAGYRVACSWGASGPPNDEVERCAALALAGNPERRDGIATATMSCGARTSGAVALLLPRSRLDEEQRLTLQTWAAVVSLRERQSSIEEEYRRLETIAESDQLTGIANRRAFDAHLRTEWNAFARTGEPFCLAIFDIDFFKGYNDRYGHLAGDKALQRVAAAIRGCLHRPRDLAARFGGEEFVIVLPDTSQTEAIAISERMREAVLALNIAHAGSGLGTATVSAGIAESAATDTDPAGIVARADQELYRAKEAGRNRVAAPGYLSDSEVADRSEGGVHGPAAASTPFIGRTAELENLSDALARCRLVTLLGPGGAGKTRLAAEASQRSSSRYRDGVWFVDVSAAYDADGVLSRIATAFASTQHDQSLTDAVIERLRSAEALLVLDGCERCIDGVRETADMLLRRTSRLNLLIVSRETLDLSGEAVLRLAGLTPEDARELFRSLSSDIALTKTLENHNELVDSICAQIDYLPLGIELLVSQLEPMSLRQLQLLVSGRIQPLRTLDDIVAWSVGLLGERRRTVFFSLSVFEGGFDRAAAAAVVGIEEGDLEAYESRSLLHPRTAGAGYRFLDVVADYSRRTLGGDLEGWRRHHFDYFISFVRTATPADIDRERENVTAALTHADERGLREELLLMASALTPYWLRRGYFNVGYGWVIRALDRSEPAKPATLANAFRNAGMLARRMRDFAAARSFNERALNLWRELNNNDGVSSALNGLALIAHTTGEFDRAHLLYEESMKLYERRGDALGVAMALNNLGGLAMYRGDYVAAEASINDAIERAGRLRDSAFEALAVNNLGEVRYLQGNYEEAITLSRRSLATRVDIGDRQGLAACWNVIANGLLALGRAEEAWHPVREALLLNHEIGDRHGLAIALLSTARLLQAQGRNDEARELAYNADAVFDRSGVPLFAFDRAVRDAVDVEREAGTGRRPSFEIAFEEALATFRS